MAVQQLAFSIEGEFITDLARQWFWVENKQYEVCEELLLSCLCTDQITLEEKKIIAQQIIEGRKKLVGLNEFSLEDDNEHIRPISEKLTELTMKLDINEIKDRMSVEMVYFVDPFSTIKSKEAALKLDWVYNYEQCQTFFWYDEHWIDHSTYRPKYPFDTDTMLVDLDDDSCEGGLWLYRYPELVYKALKKAGLSKHDNPDEAFWEAIYELSLEEKGWFFKSKSFKERTSNYEAWVRMQERESAKDSDLCKKVSEDNRRRFKSLVGDEYKPVYDFVTGWLDNHAKPDNTAPAADILKWDTMDEIKHHFEHDESYEFDRDYYRMYLILPDEYERWEGLIAPNGDFYSCSFGGHNAKAYYLLASYPEKFPNLDYETDFATCDVSNSLDTLLNQGWCALRWLPSIGAYIMTPRNNNGKITKAQENAIFDAKLAHDVSVDLSCIGY